MMFCLVLSLFVAVSVVKSDTKYTDRYDSLNLKEMLENRRLLLAYLTCMLDGVKCTPGGKELKSHISEALEQDCAKCTEAQRNGTREVVAHLINHEPEYWDRLKAKYDPQDEYSKKHEEGLRRLKQV